ncbi:MAG: GNAT family N-acetyltransferase [Gemmatimonadetes bacterium]|nr:GNAT family N-acetyltransferase [Gemmatimonadota bacterium]
MRITERDIPALNRLFADSFTDRYRRDGLVGVRVPFLNPAIWRYAIADAGEGAMLWRDEEDRVVAFNIARNSGAEAWMGPLCVRPDRQSEGLGTEIVTAGIEWLKARRVATLGLETMPRTADNIGFYSRLGFVPGHLTLTMTIETTARGRRDGEAMPLGEEVGPARAERAAAVGRLVAQLAPGSDFGREIELTLALELGDVVTVEREGGLVAFALCHAAPLGEGGGGDEARVLKVCATDEEALLAVLGGARGWAHRLGMRRLAVRCQSAYGDAYRALVVRGYRVRWTDLRMTLAGYPERRPERGVVWSNWEM